MLWGREEIDLARWEGHHDGSRQHFTKKAWRRRCSQKKSRQPNKTRGYKIKGKGATKYGKRVSRPQAGGEKVPGTRRTGMGNGTNISKTEGGTEER